MLGRKDAADDADRQVDSDWDPARALGTPLGQELHELTRRILGPGPAATEAATAALATPPTTRLQAIGRAAGE
jgi:hypothetical protein